MPKVHYADDALPRSPAPRAGRRSLPLAALALLLVAALARADERSAGDAASLFTAEAYLAHVRYLAGDELGGRLPGTPGGRAAGEYIAERFRRLGLKPAGADGSFFQPFTIRRLKKLVADRAEFRVVGLQRQWRPGTDWAPMPFSKVAEIRGPVAFAGYGIEAPEYDYDDYAEFDAQGKVLLILRYEPKAEDQDAEFGGDPPSRHAFFSTKARVAERHGAVGLLIVNPPDREPDKDELYPWQSWNTHQSYALPMAHVSRELAELLLKRGGLPDLKTLQERLDRERKPLSADLQDVTVEVSLGIEFVEGRNVVGLLEGSGGDECIVVGAHYDHLGRVPPIGGGEPQIHNGADDNASGTAGVLELARALAAGPRPRRNIVFAAFDAEELGLLGSKHFLAQPTIPVEKIRAMLNLDMIGRVKQDKLRIFGVGSAKEFDELVSRAAEAAGLKYRSPPGGRGAFGGSDHFPFYRREIPFLFAFTGVHKQYHRPEDDWELIDAEGAARLLQMLHAVIWEVANMKTGPTFVSEPAEEPTAQPAEGPASRPAEADEDQARQRPERDRPTVRLGIMPDLSGEEGGLGVDAVMPGGPAEKAGIRQGDHIVQIGELVVSDIYSYMDALREHQPGDEVTVVVERDGRRLKLKVKLGASRPRRAPERD